jgi:hypothetical protein
VDGIDDVRSTFDDMCENGTTAQYRSYFVVMTIYGYATNAIFENDYQL